MNKSQWLNKVNGDYLLSKPKNSVHIMALYAAHKSKTEKELVALIGSYYKTKCQCGIVSNGKVILINIDSIIDKIYGLTLPINQLNTYNLCTF
ncbi:hypothetical protein [Dysgonomonas reticulitermitis]